MVVFSGCDNIRVCIHRLIEIVVFLNHYQLLAHPRDIHKVVTKHQGGALEPIPHQSHGNWERVTVIHQSYVGPTTYHFVIVSIVSNKLLF